MPKRSILGLHSFSVKRGPKIDYIIIIAYMFLNMVTVKMYKTLHIIIGIIYTYMQTQACMNTQTHTSINTLTHAHT